MESMTGFGYATTEDYRIEMRSLNHRFMEINLRMPAGLSQEEPVLKEIIKRNFRRGRFDININLIEPMKGFRINSSFLERLLKELSQIGRQSVSYSNFPVLISLRDIILDEISYNREELYRCFNDALSSLKEMRLREGSVLLQVLMEGIDKIEEINDKIKTLYPEYLEEVKERFYSKVKGFLEETGLRSRMDIEKGGTIEGIVKEVVNIFDRADIEEEIERIQSHIEQFRSLIESQEPQGKRLDFLTQELLRETNTILSKAVSSEIVRLAIDMKVEIERLKEQVQNIE